MPLFRNLSLAVLAIIGTISAAPGEMAKRQTFAPGTLNHTQEFYITMHTNDGCLAKYNGWQSTFPLPFIVLL